MDTSAKKELTKVAVVEKRLREEVFLLDPFYRKFFSFAIFDKDTNILHGTKYSLHYSNGAVSMR